MKTLKVRITLQEEILGTSPNDAEIYSTYIGNKAPKNELKAEEVDAIDSVEIDPKGTTIFPKDEEGRPFLWDYQIKGFFKDACNMLQRVTGKDENGKKKKAVNESSKITAYKKIIDGLIFVFPRKIPLIFEGEMGRCQRPLRAQTMQGERVALADSETIPAGAHFDIEIKLLNEDYEKAVLEWLDYGELRGLGQWRNSGKGRFTYEVLD